LDHRRADEEELHNRIDAAHRAAGGANTGGGSLSQDGITEQTFYKVAAAAGKAWGIVELTTEANSHTRQGEQRDSA